MVGLGLTRMDGLRTFASTTPGTPGAAEGGGPASGPYSIDSLRARAAAAARWAGDESLATELQEVCCWAPAASALRERPLGVQQRGVEYFFRDFAGNGDQLARIMLQTNNTSWRAPQFRVDPEGLVANHYAKLQRPQNGLRMDVLTPERLNGSGAAAQLNLMLDRETGDRLALADDRSEPMWATLSVLSGTMLDPTDDLSRRLTPWLSLSKAEDRALARTASVRYSQIIIGAAQRAVWSDLLNDENPVMPLVELSAAGYLPLGEEDGRFLLLRLANDGSRLTGYRTGNA